MYQIYYWFAPFIDPLRHILLYFDSHTYSSYLLCLVGIEKEFEMWYN
ncbi:MAG: hypothetical protein P0S95_02105 [Rhabdochlamydiaceae bacterium]|nr:hypothetical protein [Candidatus Amphrikana amoebophyrae]